MQNIPVKARKVIPKACDACRRRKTKCNGSQPCAGCLSANLACTFDAPRGQGGNRGPRATVLNELRSISQNNFEDPQDASSSSAITATATPVEFTQSVFREFIGVYENRIYRLVSLLPVDVLRDEATRMQVSPISCQLIFAFCAYIANFGDTDDASWGPTQSSLVNSKTYYLDHALLSLDRARVTQPDPRSVYISFFLYGAYAGQGNYRQAWFYLREATTLFMMLKDEDQDWFDKKTRKRLFWILVVSERAHGVRRNRPITLPVTPSTYPLDDPLDAYEELGLRYLTSIFRPLSDIFFAVWNGSTEDCSKEWLLKLERDVRTALPVVLEISNEETANIRISQFWLQIKLWELFPRFGYLSTDSVHDCLTFRYPILVARDLTILSMKLPIQSLQIHGVGMTEKIFDIACALADVLPFVSFPASQVELSPPDYLTQLMLLLAKLPGGSSKFIPLLLAKVNELLPDLMRHMCEAIQMPIHMINDPMSPDTRFVYEEEVGRGLHADLRRMA